MKLYNANNQIYMRFFQIKTLIIVILIVMCFSTVLTAQQQEYEIALSEIMKGEEFVGYLPEQIRWSEDGETIYFNWNPNFAKLRSLFKVSRMGGKPVKVGAEEEKLLPGVGVRDKAGKRKVYANNGDIFLLYLQGNDTLQITNTIERESQPVFSGDEKYIVYRRGLNLYSWEMKTGSTRQLTNFFRGKESKDGQKPEYEQWVEQDELALMQVVKERDDREVLIKKRNKALKPFRPKKIYLEDKRLLSVKISPDLNVITYRFAKFPKARKTIVPNYVTKSGFAETQTSRNLVGAPGMEYSFGIYLASTDSSYILDIKQIPGIYDKPVFLKEYIHEGDTFNSEYDKARKVVTNGPWFSDDGKVLLEFKALDNKDRWIMMLDTGTGKLKLIDRQHDDAWIGGPGIYGWNMMPGDLGWLNSNHIWFQSEESGFSHLYVANVDTCVKKSLTSGNYEILDVVLSRDKKVFYITSNKENPFEQHFYRMSVKGGKIEKIRGQAGKYEVQLSPDEKYLAVRFSYSNRPWEL
jgi:Tol biopolymer transport system component